MSDEWLRKYAFGDIKFIVSTKRPDLTGARKCFGRDGQTVCAAYQLPDGTVYIAGVLDVIAGGAPGEPATNE